MMISIFLIFMAKNNGYRSCFINLAIYPRRTFVINMLRAGVDVFSLQTLMGHADLQVLRRYLAQTTEDIARAHRIGSPVDNYRL